MKHLIRTGHTINPTANDAATLGINRFDGTQANDGRTTRLLAVLVSVAGDHTADALTRKMLQCASAELFDAAARLDRMGQCGTSPAFKQLEGAACAHLIGDRDAVALTPGAVERLRSVGGAHA